MTEQKFKIGDQVEIGNYENENHWAIGQTGEKETGLIGIITEINNNHK